MRRLILAVLFALASATLCSADEGPLLLQNPTASNDQVVFVFAGDLWSVGKSGGEAKRLTTGTGIEADPLFSPDGTMIGFTGQYDGNVDVYVIPASGGVPRRLTYHPGPDSLVGWSPDSKRVLFRSARTSTNPAPRLFTLEVAGGNPTEVPLPLAFDGAFSSDGSHLAYSPLPPAFQIWKRYRGGLTSKLWIASLADSSIEKIPRENSNDFNPMWVGSKIYFLSDRNGPVTLYAYDTGNKKVTQVIRNDGPDIKSAAAGPGVIAYEQFGAIHLYDLRSGRSTKLAVQISGDMPGVRPRYDKVASRITAIDLSPTGARAVFEARGEILTVPAEKGNARNLTKTSGVAERDPAWSPDGRWIAYFSDESGEYALHLRDQTGMGDVRKIDLGQPPSFYYSPTWSPDSKKIAFTDKRLNLWYVEVDKGAPVRVDTNTYDNPFRVMDPAWAPDSRWITYTKQLKNRMCAVFVYSLETGKATQITDGLSDARFAAFDKSGKYLFFTASTDVGPTTGWLDMSSFPHQVTRSTYLVVLRKDLPSPLAPESDEEKVQDAEKPADKAAEKKPAETAATPPAAATGQTPAQSPAQGRPGQREAVTVTIDFENIGQRILALPIPPRSYTGMSPGKAGTIFLVESVPQPGAPPSWTIHKFDLEKRKVDRVVDGVSAFIVSHNGEKMLFRQGQRYTIAATAQPLRPGEGLLRVDEMEVYVDPVAEWKQMYREVWRIQRDFFYDPNLHGLDLKTAIKSYEPYLGGLAHRADLNYLFQEMLGEMSVGHMNVFAGDLPQPPQVPGGLLGADYKVENGRYRFVRIYSGENWNPQLRAPLTQPGVNVTAGEYLLAVNGRDLRAPDSVYSFFEATANKSVVIRVGPDPTGANSREVTVVPVAGEFGLRNLAWIEDNRRKVDQMTGGRVAYVYLPNTAGAGYTNFNRYYFAQIDKEGAVIDERFNGGGTAADYIIDYLRRPLMNYWATREGQDFTTPAAAIFGPKVMIINEPAGSGGDAMPWYFRKAGIGPLVGMRTWGGLVGIYDYPPLIDGGFITAPRVAFYNLNGDWEVENHGVAPDIEVEFDPKAWRQGRDPQLEKAVEVVLEGLKKNPLPRHKKPDFPNYHNGRPLPMAAASRQSPAK